MGLAPTVIIILSFDSSAHAGNTHVIMMSDWLSPNPPDIADTLATITTDTLNKIYDENICSIIFRLKLSDSHK